MRRQSSCPYFPWHHHLTFSPLSRRPLLPERHTWETHGKYPLMFSEQKYAQSTECLRDLSGNWPFLDLNKRLSRLKGVFWIVTLVVKHSTFHLDWDFYWREELKKSLHIFNMVLSHCINSQTQNFHCCSQCPQGHNKTTYLRKAESKGPNYLLLSESYITYLLWWLWPIIIAFLDMVLKEPNCSGRPNDGSVTGGDAFVYIPSLKRAFPAPGHR